MMLTVPPNKASQDQISAKLTLLVAMVEVAALTVNRGLCLFLENLDLKIIGLFGTFASTWLMKMQTLENLLVQYGRMYRCFYSG